jgi:hypothetical protein
MYLERLYLQIHYSYSKYKEEKKYGETIPLIQFQKVNLDIEIVNNLIKSSKKVFKRFTFKSA